MILPEQRIGNITIPTLNYQYSVDYVGVIYGGNTTSNFTATIQSIQNSGCNESDYEGFKEGSIALIKTGGVCDTMDKALMAEKWKAKAALIWNQQDRIGFSGGWAFRDTWTYNDSLVQLPTLAISYSVGTILQSLPGVQLHIDISTNLSLETTFNLFCTTNSGSDNNIVMIGAHLDSVSAGPGINDNGSGSATILEILLSMYRSGVTPHNKVRFAWWGAEELGLLGSYHYVNNLTPEEYDQIALYINFDMLGSPNYVPRIYNSSSAPLDVQNKSRVIENLLGGFYNNTLHKSYQTSQYTAGSDHYPFATKGIPVGSMATGAGGIKTIQQRTTYGGFANAQYDTCYHQACDTIDNINREVLGDIAKTAAFAIQKLAMQPNLPSYLGGR